MKVEEDGCVSFDVGDELVGGWRVVARRKERLVTRNDKADLWGIAPRLILSERHSEDAA